MYLGHNRDDCVESSLLHNLAGNLRLCECVSVSAGGGLKKSKCSIYRVKIVMTRKDSNDYVYDINA